MNKKIPLYGSTLMVGEVMPKRFDSDHVMKVPTGRIRLWLGQQIQGDFHNGSYADLKSDTLYTLESLEDNTVAVFTESPKLII